MKKHIPGSLAGVLVTTAVFGTTVTALAATGTISLEVTPVNIKVNGEVFQPKDVNGDDVMVFAYNGTTYAPLRALAEAYGLQVGWDQASGTATVVDPDAEQVAPDTTANAYADWTAEEEAAYQEFKGMWEGEMHGEKMTAAFTLKDKTARALRAWLNNIPNEVFQRIVIRHATEFIWAMNDFEVGGAFGQYWSSSSDDGVLIFSTHIWVNQPELNNCWTKEEALTIAEELN